MIRSLDMLGPKMLLAAEEKSSYLEIRRLQIESVPQVQRAADV